jgi:hypothetical protein
MRDYITGPYNIHLTMVNHWLSSSYNSIRQALLIYFALQLIQLKKKIMKKMFLVASLLAFIAVGANAGTGKNPKKSPVPKTASVSTALSDSSHHKKASMTAKKHHNKANAAKAK